MNFTSGIQVSTIGCLPKAISTSLEWLGYEVHYWRTLRIFEGKDIFLPSYTWCSSSNYYMKRLVYFIWHTAKEDSCSLHRKFCNRHVDITRSQGWRAVPEVERWDGRQISWKRTFLLTNKWGWDPRASTSPNEKYESDSAIATTDWTMLIDSFTKKVEEATRKHQNFMQQAHHATMNTL